MAPKDTKIWNEDLLLALRAREDLSRREGKRDQITWKQGANAIEAVRKDIYAVRTACRLLFRTLLRTCPSCVRVYKSHVRYRTDHPHRPPHRHSARVLESSRTACNT